MAGDNRLTTENFLRLNFTPKGGVISGTQNTLNMDCNQILVRYHVSISGETTTGLRCPSQNQLTSTALLEITSNTHLDIYFDASGSMAETFAPLQNMRDGNLRTALLPMYNNDINLYNSMVRVLSFDSERTFQALNNLNTSFPPGKYIIMVFQDESSTPINTLVNDISILRTTLNGFSGGYYKGVVFQVNGHADTSTFVSNLQAIKAGSGSFVTTNLVDKPEVSFIYDVQEGVTYTVNPDYYKNHIIDALRNLGYTIGYNSAGLSMELFNATPTTYTVRIRINTDSIPSTTKIFTILRTNETNTGLVTEILTRPANSLSAYIDIIYPRTNSFYVVSAKIITTPVGYLDTVGEVYFPILGLLRMTITQTPGESTPTIEYIRFTINIPIIDTLTVLVQSVGNGVTSNVSINMNSVNTGTDSLALLKTNYSYTVTSSIVNIPAGYYWNEIPLIYTVPAL